MKDILKKYKNNIYIYYTILFCIVIIGVFSAFIITGKGFIWQPDGYKQHYIFFYDFNQIMRNLFQEGFTMFSWEMGLGSDVIGQYSYYILGDPFAYVSLLFPMEHLETAYSILVILRIYCVGLAFITYCRYSKKCNSNILISTIMYTFCGFILLMSVRHPYFTNAAILLPLNFLAIEKLLKEDKKSFLIFVTFITAICNFYFFYMVAIITFIYAIVKYIIEYNKGIKDFFKKFFTAVGCYTIAVFMASIILLPTIYAFLNCPRTEFTQEISYSKNFYKNFFMSFISMKQSNSTCICLSPLIILMLSILFTKLKEKESKTYTVLFLITTTMLLIPVVSSFMNGFSYARNRWIFAYSFMLSYITTICFDKNFNYSKKQKILMTITVFLYALIGMFITKLEVLDNLDFYISIGVCFIMLSIILLNQKPKKSYIIIMCLVIFNIWSVSCILYLNNENAYIKEFYETNEIDNTYSTLKGKIENFEEAVEYIKEHDKSFYRIAVNNNSHQNISLMYDFNSIQTYFSIVNGDLFELSSELEVNGYGYTKSINGMDRRTKITTLLGTKYFICDKTMTQYKPYGYIMYKEIGNTCIYINKNYVSAGVMYDNYILSEEYDRLSPLEKEDIILYTAVLEDAVENVKKEEDISDNISQAESLNYTEINGSAIKNNKININKENQIINLKLDKLEKNSEIYLSIKNLKFTKNENETFSIHTIFNGTVNSKEVNEYNSGFQIKSYGILINLGVTTKNSNDVLQIVFEKKGTYTFDSLEILAVEMDDYAEKIEDLKQTEMTNVEYGNNYISGTVNSDTNGILQISTSYSDGWRAFVDGKEVDTIKVNGAFLGIQVEAGEHKVEFKYRTPYLDLGISLAILGFTAFGCILVIEIKKQK